jgi:hypothetical protein
MRFALAATFIAGAILSTAAMPIHVTAKSLPQPKALVLTLKDLPAGFTLDKAPTIDNAQAAKLDHVTKASYDRLGRITSYDVTYSHTVLVGVAEIENWVVSYRTAAGAHTAAQPPTLPSSFHRMSTGAIGNECFGYTGTQKGMLGVIVRFRRDPYNATVLVVGVAGTFDPAQAATLARIIDKRIAKSLA